MTQAIGSRRGGPIIVLAALLCVWGAARAMLWESPFPLSLPITDMILAEGAIADPAIPETERPEKVADARDPFSQAEAILARASASPFGQRVNAALFEPAGPFAQRQTSGSATSPMVAAGHSFLMAAAFKVDWPIDSGNVSQPSASAAQTPSLQVAPPFAAMPAQRTESSAAADRWSLDAFAFYRAGSGSTSISQGRVPVYGASQVAVNLQYRAAPSSDHDPRAYVRAYRAFVPDAENEGALGVSARPYGPVPVRLAAELRVTHNIFGTEIRPAAYAVTELPVQRLPFDLRMEAYGGAGYVGGSADTPFVDGQAAITREIVSFNSPTSDERMRLSLGGGAWGGAQRDASRLDVGPSVRLDLTIGNVPARLSVDWRERVAGDAAPESGVAATLSTRF